MTQVLLNTRVYVGAHDLSGQLNATSLEYAAELLDATTFGSGGTRENVGGVRSIVASHEGYWAPGADAALFGLVGVRDVPVTISPVDGADGAIAYLFRAVHGEYSPGAAHGELLAFSVSAEGSHGRPLCRGLIMQPADVETETGTGTVRQLGTVAAGKRLVASLHVLSISEGATLDVTVVSDDASGMSSPTTRLTFPQADAIGSGWQEAAGAISDTYYRVAFTVAGDDPAVAFVVAVGII